MKTQFRILLKCHSGGAVVALMYFTKLVVSYIAVAVHTERGKGVELSP